MSFKKGTHTNKMGIMQAGLHTHPREQRYGNLWGQIDFMVKEGVRGDGKDGYNNKTIGELVIGNQRVALTWTECTKIQETIMLAKEAFKTGKSLDMV
jgi:hypothetical protein|tara:strand:+ start:50 stop:340 length:291 start_codon:yes stop_codon:yes gene_type:complete